MKKKYIFLLFMGCCIAYNIGAHEFTVADLEQAHQTLNKILEKFDAGGGYQGQTVAPSAVQKEYKDAFDRYADVLSFLEEKQDPDLDVYEEWFDTYEAWESFIVTSYTPTQNQQDKESGKPEGNGKPGHDDTKQAGTNRGSIDDLTPTDGGGAKNQQKMKALVTQLFLGARKHLYSIVHGFAGKISSRFLTMGDFSKAQADELNTFFIDVSQDAKAEINSVVSQAMRRYYQQVQELSGDQDSGTVSDPFARRLQDELHDIVYQAQGEMRGFIEILKSKYTLPIIGGQLALENEIYKRLAAEEYAHAQADASREREATWWDDLKASGAEFAKDFGINFAKEFDKALDKAFDKAMDDLGAHVSENLSSLADKAGAGISSGLSKVVGDHAVEKLQALAGDKASALLDKVPGILKDAALKELGAEDGLGVQALKEIIRKKYAVEHNFSGLTVRQSTDLSSQEQRFITNRMLKVEAALQQHFGITTPLKIGLCSSGGGNRAMLTSLGFFLGVEEIGLFDAALYNAGLSGSTWTISPWSYFKATQDMSLQDFKNQLVSRLHKTVATAAGISGPPMLGSDVLESFGVNIAKRFAYNQNISTIDAYGALIGNYTLLPAGGKRLDVTWSSIASQVEQGNLPYPMGSAVSIRQSDEVKKESSYDWYEIGPFEAGSDVVGYVPTWAFGSKFDQGKPVDSFEGKAPEYPLSYYEGVYGSAYAFSAHEVLEQAIPKPSFSVLGKKFTIPIDTWLKKSFKNKNSTNARLYPASFYNFTKNVAGSPIKDADQIELYDGAMNFNFPLPLLLRPARKVDVVVICDAAQDVTSLQRAQAHFIRENMKFPDMSKLTKKDIAKYPMTVFNDPRSPRYQADMITILYFPLLKNNTFDASFDPEVCTKSGPCQTFNFKYSKEEAEKVVGLAHANVVAMKDEVQKVLAALADKK